MPDVIFLTGATGHLGTTLAQRLIGRSDTLIVTLVRAEDDVAAARRLRAEWRHSAELVSAVGAKVIPLSGDFTRPGLGLDAERVSHLADEVTHVIHAGAEVSFQSSRDEFQRTNVTGTENVIAFAGRLQALRRFVHVSTAYVAGQRRGLIAEDESTGGTFSSLY